MLIKYFIHDKIKVKHYSFDSVSLQVTERVSGTSTTYHRRPDLRSERLRSRTRTRYEVNLEVKLHTYFCYVL